MKSIAIIKGIIPLLSTVQAGGNFSNPLGALCRTWTTALGEAAIEDRIDLSPMLERFEAMGAAAEFEAQQDEIATALVELSQLLDDIPAGNVAEYVPAPEGFATVRLRLAASLNQIAGVFRPTAQQIDQLRRDAAQLAALALGQDDAETLGAAADRIYNYVDQSADMDFAGRERLLDAARTEIGRIAA